MNCIDKEIKIDGESIMSDYLNIIVTFVPCTKYMPDDPTCSKEGINEWFSGE